MIYLFASSEATTTNAKKNLVTEQWCYESSFFFLVFPSSTYLFIARVEGFCDFIRSHSSTHHSRQDSSGRGIGPSQRLLPDNTNNVQDKHPCPAGIRTHDPSKRSVADLRLRPRGHWDRQPSFYQTLVNYLQSHITLNLWLSCYEFLY
jgi:hypothetical protein